MTESSSSGRGGRSGRSSEVDVQAALQTLAQQMYILAGRVNPNDETVLAVKQALVHTIEELGGEVPPEPQPHPVPPPETPAPAPAPEPEPEPAA